jgi:hypothetical protein
MEVTSLAQPTIWNVSGFTTSADALTWYDTMLRKLRTNLKPSADATVFLSNTGQYVLSLKSKTTGTSGCILI